MWRPKGKSLTIVRLTVWAGLLTWMVFFFALGVVMAKRLADAGPSIYWGFGSELLAQVLHWIAPIWVVFTVLLVIVYVARFAARRLRNDRTD